MKIVDGVQLHLIKNTILKTNHLTFRFSGVFSEKTVARRVLVAQMLATANADYPTIKAFREKLASLYGVSLSTKVSTKGLVHIVDIDIIFIKDKYAFTAENLLEEVITFLESILFAPLVSVAQYQSKIFDTEKLNLIHYLETDKEDSFYSSELALRKLFYRNPTLQLSKYGDAELVTAENSFTAYQEFQKMLSEDQLDLFIAGEFDDYRMLQVVNKMPFEPRQVNLTYYYRQDYQNVTRELLDKRPVNQSILQLGFHHELRPQDDDYFALVVLNGLLGSFAHSLLFTEIREKEGLAYTIASHFDSFTGLFTIYAGLDKEQRNRLARLINKQLADVRSGKFSMALVGQTKEMLKTNHRLLTDNVKFLIEQAYNAMYLEGIPSTEEWLNGVDVVTKSQLMRVAASLKLQSLYFLEGNEA